MTIRSSLRAYATHFLIAPKVFYFFWFVALGSFMPFITLHYRNIGLDLAQIGVLLSLAGILQIASPLWGLLADALRIRRVLLPIVIVGAILPAAVLGGVTGFWFIFALVVIMSLFAAPVAPLADSATLAALGNARERYGSQRVWGAVGWGLSTVTFGWMVQQMGLSVIFLVYPIAGALAALAALAMPRAELVTVNVVQAGRRLLRDGRWARFLISAMLIGCSAALMHGFFSLYMEDLGAGGEQIGLAYTVASLSELPVMALSVFALRRWDARSLMMAAGFVYAIRMLLYWAAPTPEWALAIQLLHGLCFASLWTAGVVEAQRLAPPGLEATAQSLFGMAVFGVAVALANAVGGVIYRDYGYGALFAAAALVAALGAVGLASGRDRENGAV
jgi:PPP family 3-phenylpropionic acid transporter